MRTINLIFIVIIMFKLIRHLAFFKCFMSNLGVQTCNLQMISLRSTFQLNTLSTVPGVLASKVAGSIPTTGKNNKEYLL